MLTFYLLAQPKKYVSDFNYETVDWDAQAADPAVAYRGKSEFKIRCYTCHGFSGQGSQVAPALNDQKFLHGNSYEEILNIVRFGSPNGQMRGWESKLRPEDIVALTIHVKNLSSPSK